MVFPARVRVILNFAGTKERTAQCALSCYLVTLEYRDTPIRRFPQNALIGRAGPIRKAPGFAAKKKKSGRNPGKKASASAGRAEFACRCIRTYSRVAS